MALKTKGVIAFLLISFGIAWGGIFLAGFVLDLSMVDPLVQLPIAFAPAIGAVVVRAWITREGFADAGSRLRLRAAWRYYLLAAAGPVLVLAATTAVAAAVGGYRPDLASLGEAALGADVHLGLLLPAALIASVIAVPVFWGEEAGWRGYLQQRVGRGPLAAALLTGIIWAAWHYPLVFTDYSGDTDHALTLVTWTAQITAQAIVLSWLFRRSGTVWVPCLAHAGNNLVIGTLSFPLLVEQGGFDRWAVNLLELAPLAAIVAWILLTGRLHDPERTARRSTADAYTA
jgi:membrane protease YdiL (CAAX protease family)